MNVILTMRDRPRHTVHFSGIERVYVDGGFLVIVENGQVGYPLSLPLGSVAEIALDEEGGCW